MSDPPSSIFDRMKNVLHNNRFVPDLRFPERLPPPFHSKDFAYTEEDGVSVHLTNQEEAGCIRKFCTELFNCVKDSPSDATRLDRKFSELLECKFQLNGTSSPFRDVAPCELEDKITERAVQLLNRLPKTPVELPGLLSEVPDVHFAPQTTVTNLGTRRWENLRVGLHVNSNVIRLALCITIYPWIAKGKLSEFVNHTATLLDSASLESADAKSVRAKWVWYTVRAFLWTSWQRSVMLYFWFLLAHNLKSGVDDDVASRGYFLQSFSPVAGLSIQEMSKSYATRGKSPYMCSWAFELLRNQPVCIAMDFRRFHTYYADLFDGFPARCHPGAATSCEGDHPHSCQRFVGMVIRDQSAHDRGCTGCEMLIWDEVSYRLTPGARAVSLKNTTESKLRYQTASNKTLAVSHVWSHGQGGRPETGMNSCLHHRFQKIASSMECDTYWMDTPCIPSDHALRREAISNINKVFGESKATLVCDRDLMEIDIEGEISVKLRESILVTAMTCDWNVRAWTFLEAFRARQSIYLLCKNNKTLSLKETVKIVHREGSLDLGLLLLTVPHLLPRVQRQDDGGIATADKYPRIMEMRRLHEPLYKGFLTVENSGMLLSHRPASRPGDDIVIWSLLLNETVRENSIDFWRSRLGHSIHTSFLVSTAPRLDIWRFGWAPSSPRLFLDPSAKPEPRSMGLNDTTSELGSITVDGLKANWLFHRLGRLERVTARLPLGKHQGFNFRKIYIDFLKGYRWGALLRPVWANVPFEYIPSPNREDVSRVLLAICGTNDLPDVDTAWEWKGVYEWDIREPLPEFTYKKDILLV